MHVHSYYGININSAFGYQKLRNRDKCLIIQINFVTLKSEKQGNGK